MKRIALRLLAFAGMWAIFFVGCYLLDVGQVVRDVVERAYGN